MNQFLENFVLVIIFSVFFTIVYLSLVLDKVNVILLPFGFILLILSLYLFVMYKKYGRIYKVKEDDTEFIIPEYYYKKYAALSIFDRFESGDQAKFCSVLVMILVIVFIVAIILYYILTFIKLTN
jgi:hypothetical protein